MRLCLDFWNCQRGTTMIEYALLAGIISASLIGIWTFMGERIADMYKPLVAPLH